MPLERLTEELVEAIAAEYPSLSNLNLSNNSIRSIDCDLSRLPDVSRLNLSQNRLSSLPPTLSRQLPRLEQLLLAHNCFSSLDSLRSLRTLTKLDISYNKLQHIDQLDALTSLPSLIHLNLQGNAQLENTADYRSSVVSKLPRLHVLDDKEITQNERDALKTKDDKMVNPVLPKVPIPALPTRAPDCKQLYNRQIAIPKEEAQTMALLNDRISALQEILRLQESRLVGDSGKAAADQAYERLLTQWRTKVFELIVNLKRIEAEKYLAQQQENAQNQLLQKQIVQHSQENKALQQRLYDARAAMKLLEMQSEQFSKEKMAIEAKLSKTVASLEIERRHIRSIAQSVAMMHQTEEAMSKMDQTFACVAQYNQRLECMYSQVELALVALKRNQVRLRNQQAALEADKRVWIKRLQKQSEAAIPKPRAPSVRLKQETEAILRLVFHRLDPYDTGLVIASRFIQSLERDVCVRNALGGAQNLNKLIKQMQDNLQLLYPTQWQSVTWTWGEFLLVFLPDLSTNNDAPVRSVVTDEHGIPLAFENKPHPSAIESNVDFSMWSRDALEKYTRQLQKERGFLVSRLQQDAAELQARVVKVQCQWQAKCDTMTNSLVSLKNSLRESETRQVHQENEIAHLKNELQISHTQHSKAILELEQRNAAQKLELERKNVEKDALLDRLRADHVVEIQDLLEQVRTVQKVNTKQELHIRQLERQWAKAQEQTQANESAKVESLTRKLEKRDTELMKLRRERNALLATLRDLEKRPKPRSQMDQATMTTEDTPASPKAPIRNRIETLSDLAQTWLDDDKDLFSDSE